jgi:transposase
MPVTPASLPDDIDALKALLLRRDEQLQQLRNTVSTLALALSVRTLEIEQLQLQIAKLKRMQFGRKSEKIDRKLEQLETRLEDLLAEEGAVEQKQPETLTPRQKSAHQPLPKHCAGLASCMPSKRKFAGNHRTSGDGFGNSRPERSWTILKSGCGSGC